jgi:hypothetical protein
VSLMRLTPPADPPGDLQRQHVVARGVTPPRAPGQARNIPWWVSRGGPEPMPNPQGKVVASQLLGRGFRREASDSVDLGENLPHR